MSVANDEHVESVNGPVISDSGVEPSSSMDVEVVGGRSSFLSIGAQRAIEGGRRVHGTEAHPGGGVVNFNANWNMADVGVSRHSKC